MNKKYFNLRNVLAIAICLVAVTMFSACGEDDNKSSNNNGNNGGTQTSDLTTVNGFLSAFGLAENDLKCANFTRLDKTSYSLSTNEIKEVGAFVSEKLTDAEVKDWLDKVIGKLCSLSAEGKIKNSIGDGELTTDYIMSQTMYIGGGTYTYNGKKVSVTIAVTPGYLDNEDPDEAMAACKLSLEFRN